MSVSPGPRIALLEDHLLVAESLAFVLGANGYEVRRVSPPPGARTVASVLPLVLAVQPRLALLDLDLGPLGNGVWLVEALVHADVPVLVITDNPDRVQWGECVRNGASRVLPKSYPLEEILSSVGRVARGLPVMNPIERGALLGLWREHQSERHEVRRRLELLTTKEQEVLAHLMRGRSVRDIAAIGVVSEATVRTQVKSILNKLEVNSQLAAASLAHRANWWKPEQRRSRPG
jgi:two-component system, NarL family, nitrate/nitrite response regulator NarL